MRKTSNPTGYRAELKSRILTAAMNEFRQRGIRAVKMDDIAGMLKISKRTLYEIYPNKEDLLLEGIKKRQQMEEKEITEYMEQEARNVMDVILRFYHIHMEDFAALSHVFLEDMKRFPRIVAFLKDSHDARTGKALLFFKQGVDEGYFRSDVDYALLSDLSDGIMRNIIMQHLYKEYELSYIFRNVVCLLLRGFCTQKGVDIMDKSLSMTA